MYFKEATLQDFRNYKKQEIHFHPRVNIITGNNAQGKTNLLEALYMMSLGKSFRTLKDTEMIRFEHAFAKISTISCKNGAELAMEIILEEKQKSIRIDGVRAQKNSDILENVYIVVFSPEDLKIVKDEPEKRRRFINRELCQLKPIYYRTLARYKKIVLQRNALLKQEHVDPDVLSVWDEELAETGARIILDRAAFIKKLDRISQGIHTGITGGIERLEIQYESDVPVMSDLGAQKTAFYEKIRSRQRVDRLRRTTMTGPHRDDLKIMADGIDLRSFGSQGQQRTAALSLKLAEIRLIEEEAGETPILLLDDVLSELDMDRQKFLINSLGKLQIFITTTEISDYLREALPDNALFRVRDGCVERWDEAGQNTGA